MARRLKLGKPPSHHIDFRTNIQFEASQNIHAPRSAAKTSAPFGWTSYALRGTKKSADAHTHIRTVEPTRCRQMLNFTTAQRHKFIACRRLNRVLARSRAHALFAPAYSLCIIYGAVFRTQARTHARTLWHVSRIMLVVGSVRIRRVRRVRPAIRMSDNLFDFMATRAIIMSVLEIVMKIKAMHAMLAVWRKSCAGFVRACKLCVNRYQDVGPIAIETTHSKQTHVVFTHISSS